MNMIFALLNHKGGVGKSVSSITLSHVMASVFNKRTLLIDVDPQGNSSAFYDNTDAIEILISMLEGKKQKNKHLSIEDLLLDDTLDIHKVIRNSKYDNLDYIPSYLTLSVVEKKLNADVTSPQQFRLSTHLEKVKDEYDVIIIDCSPSISLLNINALAATDEVYIPIKVDAWSSVGMCIARDLVETVSKYSPKLKLGGVFFTQYEKNKQVSNAIQEVLKNHIPDLLIPFSISKSKLAEEMSYTQEPISATDPKSKICKEYIKLAEYMLAGYSKRKKLKLSEENNG